MAKVVIAYNVCGFAKRASAVADGMSSCLCKNHDIARLRGGNLTEIWVSRRRKGVCCASVKRATLLSDFAAATCLH